MLLRRLVIAAAVLAALVLPALALGAPVTKTKIVNLDGDPELEQVIPQEVCTTFAGGVAKSDCATDQYPQRRVAIADTCNGAPYTKVISSQQDDVSTLRIAQLDGLTLRPEIFFDLRSGASGRVGEARIVRWDDGPSGACPNPRVLFKYPSRGTRGHIPRGARARDGFDERIGEFSKRYPGKELRLVEVYVDRDDAFCCPSFKRITWFGYSAGKDLYVRFRTHVKRIRK